MFLWQPPHFYAIALKRKEDYKKAGIPMLPVVKGFATTRNHIILSIFLLIPATILLYFYTKMNMIYIIITICLGLGWLFTARWDRNKEFREPEIANWSQKNFIYSLIYLVILMLAMFIGAF
jgi:protoheme IX farnesyltransferase